MKRSILLPFICIFFWATACTDQPKTALKEISGIYPHLGYYNDEDECGTGAVVPWAGRLWVITYGPHLPEGSSDKLYEITPDLTMTAHPLSIGGTPANRFIHRESNQLIIGPYAIDAAGTVRAIGYEKAPGRYTGTARHLTDPEHLFYMATMEEGFYEIDATTLEASELYKDANGEPAETYSSLLPGAHGKGLYSGQGVLVYSNNGEPSPEAQERFDIESGVLAEWDGADWQVVRRNQFVEVTGPGGLYGNENPETDPVWATGWDHKSVLLGVRDARRNAWSFFRLPKASHSYDGAHGWNTEWPRIRDVGTRGQPDYLMTMHGMFWRFPGTFSADNTAGIRPRSAYLKVIGDFARWNDRLVFGTDDAAKKEFLNTRRIKEGLVGPGQSNSNLWFTDLDLPDNLGPVTASGSVWIEESVAAGVPSEPFLFAGWPLRSGWILNHGSAPITFIFEVNEGVGEAWAPMLQVSVPAGASQYVPFSEEEPGEWVRVRANQSTTATVHFAFGDREKRSTTYAPIFEGLATAEEQDPLQGYVYGLGDNRRSMALLLPEEQRRAGSSGYFELDEHLNLHPGDDSSTAAFIEQTFAIPPELLHVDDASVLVVDDKNRRWRLPKGNEAFTPLMNEGRLRPAREVATERDLFHAHGTFYELPAENADGFAKIRPISSHPFRIHDFTSYRGMLIMTGVTRSTHADNKHIIHSPEGRAAVWAGAIDDLWRMGKPVGQGGPWKDTDVEANVPSDPYLFGFYDKRTLYLSHESNEAVTFVVEMEPVGHGPWMEYMRVSVSPGDTLEYVFPEEIQSRWIRFTMDRATRATAWLVYE